MYVRFQSPQPNQRGSHPGVFGLVNGLGKRGELSPDEERFRLENNAWYQANFTDPSAVDATVYDRELNPCASAWFKLSATHLIDRVAGYLAILDAHGKECVRVESTDPGHVIYEDEHQIVVIPYETGRARG